MPEMGEIICSGGGEIDWSILDTLSDESIEDTRECICTVDSSEVSEVPVAAIPRVPSVGYGRTKYRFPANDPAVIERLSRLSVKSDSELLGMIKKLTTGRDLVTGKVPPYVRVRPFVVAISMILNERQVCPPRFRPKRKAARLSKGSMWDDELSTQSNDRQVLDLHWLACSTSDIQPVGKWAGLFSADGLHFDLASEFVATVGETINKIRTLGLHQGEMRQLAVFQSSEMQKRWADLEVRAESEARPRLREWKEKMKGRARAAVDELVIHFLVIGLVGGDHPTDSARLASLISGSDVSAKTMERRFDLFQRLRLLRRTSS